jgi:Fic family protein
MLLAEIGLPAFEGRPDPESNGEYLHWDDVRRRTPPVGLDHRAWWLLIQWARQGLLRSFPLRDSRNREFVFGMPDSVLRLAFSIERDASGNLELPEDILNRTTRDKYIVSSLIEEAITSSQLEGASTTHVVATQMLETGRAPANHDERMIWNNYRAMEWVRAHLDRPLSPDLVLELHRVVATDALDGGNDGAGRLRRADERVAVVDHDTGEVVHTPPAAATLTERLRAMCAFANGEADDRFVHPVIRAILLHYWLAYDHPFIDGNGRTARALFYWSMLRQGYWLAEFLSISRILKKARAQYARAFQLTEDQNDATYFVAHQLRVIRRAIDELRAYLRRKTSEVRDVGAQLKRRSDLNARQLALIADAVKDPDRTWTIQQHQRTSGVVYQTARSDLLGLVKKRFLEKRKVGRSFVFGVPADIERRVKRS